MRSLTLTVITLLLITFSVNAQSLTGKNQNSKYTKQFTFEAGGELFYTSATMYSSVYGNDIVQSRNHIFSLKGNAGIFVLNGLKLGVEPAVTLQKLSGDNSLTQIGLYFAPEYVYNTKTMFYPYIGAALGYTYSRASYYWGKGPEEFGVSYGAKAGMKVNFFGNSLLNVGFTFYSENHNHSNSPELPGAENHYDILGLTLGWSVYF